MEIVSLLIGFGMGVLLMWVVRKFQQGGDTGLGSVTLGNVECYSNDTMLRIPYTVTGGTPVDVRVITYESTAGQPGFQQGAPVATNPAEISIPSSTHDRVMLVAAFACDPADAQIPCHGTSPSSGSGSHSLLADARPGGSTLP